MKRSVTTVLFACAVVAANFTIQSDAQGAAHVVGPSTSSISVEIGKGRLIRLDTPATSVFIADPKVADIEVKSPTLVYVTGKAPGETTLFAVDEHDVVLANMGVAV